MRFYTAEEWLRNWLKGKAVAKSEGTFLKYAHTLETFLASLGERAKRNINQIAPRDIQRFRDAQIEDGKHRAPVTSLLNIYECRSTSRVGRG
ncbi:MAG: site-specific integrase [Chthoniobacterales bacterium]